MTDNRFFRNVIHNQIPFLYLAFPGPARPALQRFAIVETQFGDRVCDVIFDRIKTYIAAVRYLLVR